MTAIGLALLAFAPWLTVLPLPGAAGVLAHVLTLVAAFHGAGLAVAALARRPTVHPMLAIQWGMAALVALSGVALVLGIDGRVTQTLVVCLFAGLHTVMIGLGWRRYRARLVSIELRWVLVPAVLLGLLAIVHVLGAAGDLGARPFDDDGNVIAQLQRLRDTGALGDPAGYARGSQLGGQLVLGALATLPGDVHLVRVLEALAFVLALGLVIARLRVRDATGGIWATLLLITGSALAFAPVDPTTCWTAVGLIVALHAMLTDDEPRALLPIALVAGALITLRHELAPIGITAVLVTWWPLRADRKRSLLLLGATLAVVLPFLLARFGARLPADAEALLLPRAGGLAGRTLFAGLVAAGIAIVMAVVPARQTRWIVLAGVVTLAGIVSGFTGARPYATQFLWPLAIAGGLVLVLELGRTSVLTTAAMIVSLVAIVLVQGGRDATGRVKWTRRYLDLASNIEYLRHAGDHAPVTGGYAPVLRNVPAGTTVAVWVNRPERLDYTVGYRIVDLRTPRAARLRTHRFEAHASRMQKLLTAIDADYLLIEADDRHAERIRASYFYRFVCATPSPACADDLEAIAQASPVVAEHRGVRLVKLP